MDFATKLLLAGLRRSPKALKAFQGMPPSHRARWISFVAEAKRPETREKRIRRCVQELSRPTKKAARSGYSGTPLPRKLGLQTGHRVTFLGAPEGFSRTLGALPAGVEVFSGLEGGPFDVAVLFVVQREHLELAFPATAQRLKPSGGLWVAWPKKASGVPSDLTEDRVREVAVGSGLVDNKVCAIDDVWSGLRCVYRVKDRPTVH